MTPNRLRNMAFESQAQQAPSRGSAGRQSRIEKLSPDIVNVIGVSSASPMQAHKRYA
eukprot:CAMPEP_0170296294 /NCGR_PEP_ID=MMETSP0116_2-20130129/48290_1 /TAXON_ID=400756 /ORGANISM="Durinskia baltica, Strain CSIRO CS-38" /LENGTH=56 /DNA_ID=CAMNT_0010547883 /DNA_START=29 /DNA_END=199 /DNA_ORIENTATION=+